MGWNSNIPLVGNSVSNDLSDMNENFTHIYNIFSNFINEWSDSSATDMFPNKFKGTAITYSDSPYTIVDKDIFITVDATSGNTSLVLPDPATNSGRMIAIKRIDSSSNTVTLTGTVDGSSNPTIDSQYESLIILAVSSAWRVFSRNYGEIVSFPNQSSIRIKLSSEQTISASTFTKITYDTESYDVQNEYDNSTNHRFTATQDGKYLIIAGGGVKSAPANSYIAMVIYKNGSTWKTGDAEVNSTSGQHMERKVTGIADLSAGDYIEIYCQNSATSSIVIDDSALVTYLEIHKIG